MTDRNPVEVESRDGKPGREFMALLMVDSLEELLSFHDRHMGSYHGFSPFSFDLILKNVQEIAASGLHVLVHGETGTGKEVVVKKIVEAVSLKGRLISVNCAAIPPALAESELFGHVKGAFSGAVKNKDGLIKEADGGVLFLDEIGELPHYMQAKLLRVIEEKKFTKVGSTDVEKVKFRLIAATRAF